MVVPKAGYIARNVFNKVIVNGYLQSVVAASQSSQAAQQHTFGNLGSRLGKSHNLQHHNAFSADRNQRPSAKQAQESGLAAYYAAWQKGQQIGSKEWQQYQFAKRIEWKPQTLLAETKTESKDEVKEAFVETLEERERAPAPKQDRSYSTSAVDDLRKNVDAETITQVAEALSSTAAQQDVESSSAIDETSGPEMVSRQTSPHSVTSTADYTLQSSFASETTPASPFSDSDSYSAQLTRLADNRHYAEIPAVFEAMLHSGVTPTASAYNALLLAAIHLPKSKHHVVPKALNVYSDMLKRSVLPDRKTYSVLVDLLSARALEVASTRNALEDKRARFGGLEEAGKFMLKSEEAESLLLAEDDSLSLAIRMFDAATSIYPTGFSERTYRLLVCACAEQGRIQDMVRIYQQMESRRVTPRPEMFVNMIHAFATSGDLRSAVECYNEYKALAIAHDNGELTMARKDDDVYASVVKAYMISKNLDGAERFFSKLEAAATQEEKLASLRDTVGLRAFLAEWLKQGQFEEAFVYVSQKLTGRARDVGLSAVCIRAADRDSFDIAAQAFSQLSTKADVSSPAVAMVAMHIRNGNLDASEPFWNMLERAAARADFIQPTAMRTVALIGSGQADVAMQTARRMFSRVREAQPAVPTLADQIDEAIEVIGNFMAKRSIFLPATQSMELMWAMIDNRGLVPAVASHLLAGMGPEEISQLSWADLQLLVQVQGTLIINGSHLDIGYQARFSHLLQLVSTGAVDAHTQDVIHKALARLNRPESFATWQQYQYPASNFVGFVQPPAIVSQPTAEDSYDPYAATTDNKGSVAITDLLEKPHGRFSTQLNEALARFKNMRRAGRHPRFFTYAKLISAAAKENRLQTAHDVLALAKQDVPYLAEYRIVRYGWVTILDSMVAACLTTGRRDLAAQYHQELLSMGAAPSANTFGLYITTLKESTKTFDEASEAVKIFLQAKSEGVEPSSFLYNALIGKLGKARRIDDCLFYFQEMRNLGIRPTSVTYGTIVNALCRVSDEKFAEELFEEMESMPNYKPRPAPYHSMMQFFLATKRDRSKVLNYYERMRSKNIQPTTHTYKLLIDTYATLDPIDMEAAEGVLEQIRQHGELPEAVHFASLIHAKGCVLRDMEGAKKLFDSVLADRQIRLQACLFQALFESMVANTQVEGTDEILAVMQSRGIEVTPYIANALIHGWANAKDINKAEAAYQQVSHEKREPSTYEAMTRAYIALEDREKAMSVVNEALSRGYPTAVANKILDLVGGGKPQELD
jgi:pentatricopeptide repeat protein